MNERSQIVGLAGVCIQSSEEAQIADTAAVRTVRVTVFGSVRFLLKPHGFLHRQCGPGTGIKSREGTAEGGNTQLLFAVSGKGHQNQVAVLDPVQLAAKTAGGSV